MLFKHLIRPIKLRYDGKKTLGPNAYSFVFTSPKPLRWQAGQQVLLEILLPDKHRTVQSFPIMTAPAEKVFRIATKINPDSPDVFKQTLMKLKPGDTITSRGIFGHTVIRNYSKEYAFLTAGIGIAPLRAILKQLIISQRLDTKITLFFVGNKDSHYFKDELNDFKTKLKNLDVEYIYKPDRITGQIVMAKMGDRLLKTTYFIAGSPTIVRNYRRILLGLGVSYRSIKSNHYLLIKHHQNDNPARLLTIK
jgi:nitric oxide dioxygenase